MDALKRINSLRLARGWSVYRLSVEADLPQSTLINMFSRETQPSLYTLERVCAAFGITLSEFFKQDDPSEEGEVFFNRYLSLSPEDRKIVEHLVDDLCARRD